MNCSECKIDKLKIVKRLQDIIYDLQREVIRLEDDNNSLDETIGREEKSFDIALDQKDQEIERLKKEKEWLLNYCLFLEYRPSPVMRNEAVELNILHRMQQALKERQ